MRRCVFWGLILVSASAAGQVRCKMPNGLWIEQRLTASCPSGAVQAQSMDGKPLPLTVPSSKPSGVVIETPAPKKLPVQPEPSESTLKSTKRQMPFDGCVAIMTNTILQVGGAKTRVIVSAPDFRVMRVCTNDGSVLLTCNAAEGVMVTTVSPYYCD